MNKKLNLSKIEALIPHRSPMLLLDEACILCSSEITGTYCVRGDEFFLQGHYPGNPIVPGNIQNEMLAQLAAVLVCYNMTQPELPYGSLRRNRIPLLAGVDNARFKTIVHPGDSLMLKITLTKDVGLLVNAKGTICINDSAPYAATETSQHSQPKLALAADLALVFM